VRAEPPVEALLVLPKSRIGLIKDGIEGPLRATQLTQATLFVRKQVHEPGHRAVVLDLQACSADPHRHRQAVANPQQLCHLLAFGADAAVPDHRFEDLLAALLREAREAQGASDIGNQLGERIASRHDHHAPLRVRQQRHDLGGALDVVEQDQDLLPRRVRSEKRRPAGEVGWNRLLRHPEIGEVPAKDIVDQDAAPMTQLAEVGVQAPVDEARLGPTGPVAADRGLADAMGAAEHDHRRPLPGVRDPAHVVQFFQVRGPVHEASRWGRNLIRNRPSRHLVGRRQMLLLPGAQLLYRVSGLLGVHDRVMVSAEEDQVRLVVKFRLREVRVSPRAIGTAGHDVSNLSDHRRSVHGRPRRHDLVCTTRRRAAIPRLREKNLQGRHRGRSTHKVAFRN
jgi:hypothetical protein